jgi:hypothetical protein
MKYFMPKLCSIFQNNDVQGSEIACQVDGPNWHNVRDNKTTVGVVGALGYGIDQW